MSGVALFLTIILTIAAIVAAISYWVWATPARKVIYGSFDKRPQDWTKKNRDYWHKSNLMVICEDSIRTFAEPVESRYAADGKTVAYLSFSHEEKTSFENVIKTRNEKLAKDSIASILKETKAQEEKPKADDKLGFFASRKVDKLGEF